VTIEWKVALAFVAFLLLGISFLVVGGTTTLFGTELHAWLNQPSEVAYCIN
jgi:hypothetical protein